METNIDKWDAERDGVLEHLSNGEYYHQIVDLKDRSIIERFVPDSDNDVMGIYWNDEAGEIKYQIAEGSEIDQLIAQWYANIRGLGDIFDPDRRITALESLFRIYFKPGMRGFSNHGKTDLTKNPIGEIAPA